MLRIQQCDQVKQSKTTQCLKHMPISCTCLSPQDWAKKRIKQRRHDAHVAVRQAWLDFQALNVAMEMAVWNLTLVSMADMCVRVMVLVMCECM